MDKIGSQSPSRLKLANSEATNSNRSAEPSTYRGLYSEENSNSLPPLPRSGYDYKNSSKKYKMGRSSRQNPTNYTFKFNEEKKGFEVDSFDPSFCDDRITKDQIDSLLEDLNSSSHLNPRPKNYLIILLIVLPIIIAIASVAILLGEKHEWVVGLLWGLTFLIFIPLFVVLFLKARGTRKIRGREIQKILDKHAISTFTDKDVNIKIDEKISYLKILFKWKQDTETGESSRYGSTNGRNTPQSSKKRVSESDSNPIPETPEEGQAAELEDLKL